MTFVVNTLHQLEQAAQQLLNYCGNYRIFAFYGQMGIGKTTFIKAICRQLHCTDNVSSPTFALVNEYLAGQTPVYHLDLYRLKNIDEAFDIGIIDYLHSNGYCFIEWPEIIEPILNPHETVGVHLSLSENNSRLITIQAP